MVDQNSKGQRVLHYKPLVLGMLLALGSHASMAAFQPFADDEFGNAPDPALLVGQLLAPGANGISSFGNVQFQGNTGISYFGGGEFPIPPEVEGPDTVLGYFDGPAGPGIAASYVLDDTSPLGDGLAEAIGGSPGGGTFGLGVSGFDDFGLTGNHSEFGDYTLYLTVLDGINDPLLDAPPFDEWENGESYIFDYVPWEHADLAIQGFLDSDMNFEEPTGEVDYFTFDPGTPGDGDGSWSLPDDAFVYDPSSEEFFANGAVGSATPPEEALLQAFLDQVDDGYEILAVIDNTPGIPDGDPGGYGETYMGSASFVSDFNLGNDDGADLNFGDGILLTSGVGTPPESNTSGSFSGQASGFGDAALDQILETAGNVGLIDPNVPSTDATVLTFDFQVEAGHNAISLDFMYGTEEYPNWNYPDLAAIIIDGRNYAIFEDGTPLIFDPDTPISSVLIDNEDGHLAIEYDAISPVRNLVAPLDTDLTIHTIKLAVSDARDDIYDTGLFIGNMSALTVESGVDPSDPILPPPDDDPTDGFDFRLELGDAGFGLDPTTPIWIDPIYAVGYEYEVSGSTFASATLPAGYGDDLFEVSWWDAVNGTYVLLDSGHDGGQFSANEIINFLTLVDPQGITKFKVEGIEPAAQLDPNDPVAFATGVSFTSGGTVDVTMTPITENFPAVPEPAMVSLLGGGLIAFGLARRRRTNLSLS